jgi:hypothetical protein
MGFRGNKKMTENTKIQSITKSHPITIDLSQFKLHFDLKKEIELTLKESIG